MIFKARKAVSFLLIAIGMAALGSALLTYWPSALITASAQISAPKTQTSNFTGAGRW
ncbi:hypothetical protein [Dyella solisilvae]|uniref:hypothetical protein n=1 Tax=Dyella solisilvae TaxID=1920168 RepID=UPI001314577A|nr:hypothetical protein [Dyella solisilvae]